MQSTDRSKKKGRQNVNLRHSVLPQIINGKGYSIVYATAGAIGPVLFMTKTINQSINQFSFMKRQ